ncbi:MAG TPA: hypothetical protein VE258_00350, partial [Ktedonobacterales bacterium]|nr:hypothetical protein [Ktedonobacterales bacterium]
RQKLPRARVSAVVSEMDEGERVVDSPVERRGLPQRTRPMPAPAPALREAQAFASGGPDGETAATEKQMASIRKLCEVLGKPEPTAPLSYGQARELITQLSGEYQRHRRAS